MAAAPRPTRRQTIPVVDVAQSNSTASLFLGVNQPTWMTLGRLDTSPSHVQEVSRNGSASGIEKTRTTSRSSQSGHNVPSCESSKQTPVRTENPSTGVPSCLVLPSPAPSDEGIADKTGQSSATAARSPQAAHPPQAASPVSQFAQAACQASHLAQAPSQASQIRQAPPQAPQLSHAPSHPPKRLISRIPDQPNKQHRPQPGVRRPTFHGATYPTPLQPTPNQLQPAACDALLGAYVTQCGGPGNISPPLLSRLKLLRDASCAVESMDYFYLVTHQILCLACIDQTYVPPVVRVLPKLYEALKDLDDLLHPTRDFGPHFANFFASFPGPINQLIPCSNAYAGALGQVVYFLSVLPLSYQAFEAHCYARHWPPLVEELVEHLGLSSPILQRIVFTGILRRIWPGVAESALPAAATIFQKNQGEYQQMVFGTVRTQQPATVLRHGYTQAYMALYANGAHISHIDQRLYQPGLTVRSQPASGSEPRSQATARYSNQSQLAASTRHTRNSVSLGQHGSQGCAPEPQAGPPPVPAQRVRQESGGQAMTSNAMRASAPTVQAVQAGIEYMPVPGADAASPIAPRPSQVALQLEVSNMTPLAGVSKPRFFPAPNVLGNTHTPTEPHRYAIHQAYLRSPTLKITQIDGHQRMYQFISGFALRPKQVVDQKLVHEWDFVVSDVDFATIAQDTYLVGGASPVRHLEEHSQTYRLRCVEESADIDTSQWVIAETKWPINMYFTINGERLHPRRKLQHGRDLAIDVTPHIKKGQNSVKILSNRSKDAKPFRYAVAVEIIKLKKHDDIKSEVSKRVIPYAEIKRTLVSSLTTSHRNKDSSTSSDIAAEDEDVMISGQNVSVSLVDPFMGTDVFNIPARGMTCRHRECFDLETYLNTRRGKDVDEPAGVDEWKCPICGADARPCSLVVDGYLAEVRSVLAAVGQLKSARAIMIDDDGQWTVKDEKISLKTRSTWPQASSKSGKDVAKLKAAEVIVVDVD